MYFSEKVKHFNIHTQTTFDTVFKIRYAMSFFRDK